MMWNRSFSFRLAFPFLLLVFLCSPAAALQREEHRRDREALQSEEVEDYYEKWLKEDVIYIITDEERAIFNQLTTPEEKESFIEQFWLRRDPDPRTAINEFKEEHYRRIAYANEHFTSGDPGWMTDRGRIYIIHGPPDSIESRPTGGVYKRPLEEGGGTTSVYPYEKWRYRYIEGLGQDVELEFVDPTFTDKYQLAVFPWEKDALMTAPGMGKTLMEELGVSTRAERPAFMPAAGGAGYNPQEWFRRLKDTPFARYELLAKAQAAPRIKYRDLKEQVQVNIQYENLPIQVHQDYFKLNDAQVLVPITIQIPNRELSFKPEGDLHVAKLAVYGIVTSMTNRIITEFDDDLITSYRSQGLQEGLKKASVYQKIIPLEARMRYKLDLIVKDLHSGHVGVTRMAISPPNYTEEKLDTSSLILSNLVEPMERVPEENEMFVLGDVKVIPKLDKEFTPEMPLGVYLQVYNAAIDQQSFSPSLQVVYRLYKDGELLKEATDENGESTQFFSGRRVVLIKHLSLADLEPGRYQVQVEVVDRLTARQAQVSGDFKVVQPLKVASGGITP